jgi:hypothetical protein
VQRAGLLPHLRDRLIPLLLAGDVQFEEVRRAAAVVDLPGQFLTALLAASGDEDGCPSFANSRADARPMPP